MNIGKTVALKALKIFEKFLFSSNFEKLSFSRKNEDFFPAVSEKITFRNFGSFLNS